jgi:hypothetical protein
MSRRLEGISFRASTPRSAHLYNHDGEMGADFTMRRPNQALNPTAGSTLWSHSTTAFLRRQTALSHAGTNEEDWVPKMVSVARRKATRPPAHAFPTDYGENTKGDLQTDLSLCSPATLAAPTVASFKWRRPPGSLFSQVCSSRSCRRWPPTAIAPGLKRPQSLWHPRRPARGVMIAARLLPRPFEQLPVCWSRLSWLRR